MTRSWPTVAVDEPLMCSQGGIPFNKAHLDARDAEIERLREQLGHAVPAIDELTKEREMYRMRWLGNMTKEEAALIRAKNKRLRAALWLLVDKLTVINNDNSFQGIWGFLHAHGYRYTGPTWEQELNDARFVLADEQSKEPMP